MEISEILKVKIQGQGYLVNDEMSVPKADGNRHYELVKEWLDRKSTRLNSSHSAKSRMPSSA